MMPGKGRSPIVYSTEQGRVCPACGKPAIRCACRKGKRKEPPAHGDGIVRVRREIKGRRGKTVTTISGAPVDDRRLKELAKHLKRRCGTGGSVKDGIIVIQGDHRDILITELQDLGYTVKRAGG